MRKYYFVLFAVLLYPSLKAQIINFPDANFKAKLLMANPENYIASTDSPNCVGGNIQNCSFSSYHPIDVNADGEIEVSEAQSIKFLSIPAMSNISSLEGIEAFSNLQFLICEGNMLTSLNVSSLSNLRYLDIYSNHLSSLVVDGLSNLQFLNCQSNQLTSLNVSGLPNLEILFCSSNQLPNLNVSGLNNLKQLDCSNNQLPTINVSGLSNLQVFYCSNNQLSALNLSGLTNLLTISCNNNQIPALDLTGLVNLIILQCNENLLTALDVSMLPLLREIYCGFNQISTLNLNGLVNLRNVTCYNNLLSALDLSGLDLTYLYCSSNQIQSLNVGHLTHLNYLDCSINPLHTIDVTNLVNLQTFYCSGNELTTLDISTLRDLVFFGCNDNHLTTLDMSHAVTLRNFSCDNNPLVSLNMKNGKQQFGFFFDNNPVLEYICVDEIEMADIQTRIAEYGYTNCHANSYCSFTPGGTFYTIQGNNRFDSNANGCEAGDIAFPNLKLTFSDGTNTGNLIADVTGNYYFDVQAGTQTITPVLENPAYFNISPATTSIAFPSVSSPFLQDYCISANGNHNDLEVSMLPIIAARPGFDSAYKIRYKNKGTQMQSGTISFAFNDAVLDLVNANPSVSSQVINYLNWNFTSLQPFETREITVTLNLNSPIEVPPVHGADVLDFTASINNSLTDETPNDNTFVLNQTVVNSFDPNDKTCLEGNTITPEMVGKDIHYLIRFENTGTANAENIVVKDMIDTTKFDISSLVPIDGSHPFVTKISNTNKVEFIFENINLPFDDANNDGYVAFKIKTKPTLVLGDTFSNTASIYFDYNFPIVTDPAVTTIALLANQDFEFERYFRIYPNPANNILNIEAVKNINITSINIYNALGQLVLVIPNAQQTKSIDVSGLKTGNYFLKINSDRGSAVSKLIKQ